MESATQQVPVNSNTERGVGCWTSSVNSEDSDMPLDRSSQDEENMGGIPMSETEEEAMSETEEEEGGGGSNVCVTDDNKKKNLFICFALLQLSALRQIPTNSTHSSNHT